MNLKWVRKCSVFSVAIIIAVAPAIAMAGVQVPGVRILESVEDIECCAREDNGRMEIRLQQAVFDPLEGMPDPPPSLQRAGDAGYHLVQFTGPIRKEWRAALEAAGAEILDYVPDFAYLVRMDAGASRSLQALDAVRWSGGFPPAFRVSSLLSEAVDRPRADIGVELMVRAFKGEAAGMIAQRLIAAGALIDHRGRDTGGGAVFRVRVDETQVAGLALIPGIAWIEPFFQPALANEVARSATIVNKDAVEQQLGLYGQGQIVAVVDSGLSTGDPATVHWDFLGRVAGGGWGEGGNCSDWGDHNSHGTHVAGSVLGSGYRSGANAATADYAGSNAGIAPGAQLVVWSNCEDFSGVPFHDLYGALWSELYQLDPQLRVSNNSWAQGGSQGQYNAVARETDRFLWDFPDMVVVFAAGNAGTDQDADGVSDLTTVLAPSTAKNVITVGGSENLRLSGGTNPGGGCSTYGSCWPGDYPAEPIAGDFVSDNIEGMYAASGRGPTLSNRLKPDIVAPATNIVSARNESIGTGDGVYSDYYIYMGGTSMAAPQVSGGAAIVREYFQQFKHDPSAALVKATLINGAHDMTPGQYASPFNDVWRRPDINQGWGRMNLANTLIFKGNRAREYFEAQPGLQTGQMGEVLVTLAGGGSAVRFTLTWTDAPGLEATHGALVNDLDLEVVAPDGTIHFGFAGFVGQQRDRFNNFEEVEIQAAPAGEYTVRVIGFNVPMGPQPFALVVTGVAREDRVFRDRFE